MNTRRSSSTDEHRKIDLKKKEEIENEEKKEIDVDNIRLINRRDYCICR